jgi:hypothetical protein
LPEDEQCESWGRYVQCNFRVQRGANKKIYEKEKEKNEKKKERKKNMSMRIRKKEREEKI